MEAWMYWEPVQRLYYWLKRQGTYQLFIDPVIKEDIGYSRREDAPPVSEH